MKTLINSFTIELDKLKNIVSRIKKINDGHEFSLFSEPPKKPMFDWSIKKEITIDGAK